MPLRNVWGDIARHINVEHEEMVAAPINHTLWLTSMIDDRSIDRLPKIALIENNRGGALPISRIVRPVHLHCTKYLAWTFGIRETFEIR